MTDGEAAQLTQFLRAAFPNMSEDQGALYQRMLQAEDCETASKAILKGITEWRFPPSWANVKDVIKREARGAYEPAQQRSGPATKMPLWVRRWIAARFLFATFGKDKDHREFPEQHPMGAPPGIEMMPEDAWVEEAEHITEEKAWNAIRGGTG